MSVSVTSLKFDPGDFRGVNVERNAEVSYSALISNEPDPEVNILLILDNEVPVIFIDENGERVKQLPRKQKLTTRKKTYTIPVVVMVTKDHSEFTETEVKLRAQTKTRKQNTSSTFIFYK